VLATLDLSYDSSSDGEQTPDPACERGQLRRIHLRNKGGLTLRASGVHIRRDIGAESADVQIATTDGALISLPSAQLPKSAAPSPRPTPRSRRPATTAKAKIRSEPDTCAPMLPPPPCREGEAQVRDVQASLVCLRAAPPRATALGDSRRWKESVRRTVFARAWGPNFYFFS
jgi:hypothetical protein